MGRRLDKMQTFIEKYKLSEVTQEKKTKSKRFSMTVEEIPWIVSNAPAESGHSPTALRGAGQLLQELQVHLLFDTGLWFLRIGSVDTLVCTQYFHTAYTGALSAVMNVSKQ